MKNLSIVSLVLFVVLMASCKKENAVVPVNPVQPSLKKMIKMESSYSNGTTEFNINNYDEQARIISYESTNDITTFDYSTPNKVLATRKERATQKTNLLYECDLNDKGLVQKVAIKYPDGKPLGEYRYIYNNAGYVVIQEGDFITYNFKNEYEIVDGNIISSKKYDNNVLSSTTNYTIDKTVNNTFGWRSGAYWSSALFGKELKNVTSESITTNTSGNITWHVKNSFVSNAQGNITGLNRNYPLTGFWEKTIVSYQ